MIVAYLNSLLELKNTFARLKILSNGEFRDICYFDFTLVFTALTFLGLV